MPARSAAQHDYVVSKQIDKPLKQNCTPLHLPHQLLPDPLPALLTFFFSSSSSTSACSLPNSPWSSVSMRCSDSLLLPLFIAPPPPVAAPRSCGGARRRRAGDPDPDPVPGASPPPSGDPPPTPPSTPHRSTAVRCRARDADSVLPRLLELPLALRRRREEVREEALEDVTLLSKPLRKASTSRIKSSLCSRCCVVCGCR